MGRNAFGVTLAVIVLLIPAATGPAVADDPGPAAVNQAGTSATDQFIAEVGPDFLGNQEQLQLFKSWILELPGIDDSGYFESVNNATEKSTRLLWSGSSPLRAEIKAEGARRGIAVSFQSWRYTRAQVDGVIDAILVASEKGTWDGVKITQIDGPTVGQENIVVHAETALDMVKSSAAIPDSIGGVPVEVSENPGADLLVGRSTDSAPFNAGAFMRSPGNNTICSTGFGIYGANGNARTITARHCNRNDYRMYDNSNTLGASIATSTDGAARMLTATGSPLIWDGTWSQQEYRKTVVGKVALSLNDVVCTSGGNSGVHCGINVGNLNVTFNDGFGSFRTIRGNQASGKTAAVGGDSGGPVFVPLSNGTQVYATGMIQAGVIGTAVTCPSIHATGNSCYSSVLFSSIQRILNGFSGSSLRTG